MYEQDYDDWFKLWLYQMTYVTIRRIYLVNVAKVQFFGPPCTLRFQDVLVPHLWVKCSAILLIRIQTILPRLEEEHSGEVVPETFGPPKPWKMKVLGPQYMGHNP